MIIKFKTSKSCMLEDWERNMQKELSGPTSLDFYRHSDYVGTVAVEMDNVVDYEVGRVWVNQERFECVYAKMGIEDDKYTRNLIISGDDFEALLMKLREKEVQTPEQVLNSI
jgi:hypothetical protein